MLEDEKRTNKNESQNNDNITEENHGKGVVEEDIFAEPDIEIPEEIKAADEGAGDGTPDTAGQVRHTGQPVAEETAQTSEQANGRDTAASSQYRMAGQNIPGNSSERYEQTSSYHEEKDSGQKQYSYIPSDRKTKQTAQEKKHRKHINNYAKAIVCAVLCGVIVGGCIIGSFAIGKNVVQTSVPVSTNEAKLSAASSGSADNSSASSGSEYTVAEISKQCSSSVVAITNKGISEVQTMFGVYQRESEGSGSGVIVSQTDSELLIVTNYHVVEGSEELTVCFNDSEDAVYSAQIKGTDSSNDLAVVAIQLSDISEEVLNSISIATIGDSDSLQVGDGVVAIGNALGLGQSVTSGVVSALDREVTIDNTTSTLLQTDAAINPGNSGGALFNMKGELIGINSAKYASEEVEGMGFAIPMSIAQPIIENLMTKETRTKLTENYGCLNITGSNVSSEAAQLYGIPQGAYVASVLDGGAAANAGIQEGDIITGIGDTSVTSIEELKEELQYYAAGETVEMTIQRNNGGGYEEQTLSVTLDNASEQDVSALQGNSKQSNQNGQENSFGDSQGNGFGFR